MFAIAPRVLPKILAFLIVLSCTSLGLASRILLVPIDNRPAAGQFPQMIGAIAGYNVKMPPEETLGSFTTPGKPSEILTWLENQDYRDVTNVIVSIDMIAYGGLVASRTPDTSLNDARARIQRLIQLRQRLPKRVKFFVFATTMRLAPTATIKTAPYRQTLAKFEELKDRFERTGDRSLLGQLQTLRNKLPEGEIYTYERTRNRNLQAQIFLLQKSIGEGFDFVLMGQDDAKPDGPHIQENIVLRKWVKTYNLENKVQFCEGIDQHANLLVSRAILENLNWKPNVRVVYSDPRGAQQFAIYESKTIEESFRDQVEASGAEVVDNNSYDYILYLNTPKRSASSLERFLELLRSDLEQGMPCAVADINFGADGASDEQVINALFENRRLQSVLTYAGWNTAGNTMGTAIPCSNVLLAARRFDLNTERRELAQKEFLFHRIIDDWYYHKFTRASTYRLIDSIQRQRDEVYGLNYKTANAFASKDLAKFARILFENQFSDTSFMMGTKEFKLKKLTDLKISLPWTRAYEIRVDFKFGVGEASE